MPKIKTSKDLDPAELDGQEYEEREDFGTYDGPVPPRGTILRGRVKRVWYTLSQASGNDMLVILWEAEGNKGKMAVYNGMAVFDRIVFIATTAFRYQPFNKMFGITVSDVKDNMVGEDEEGSMGIPVTKIGKWKIDSNRSLCRITTKMSRKTADYPDPRVEISKYMPYADDGAADDADDDGADESGDGDVKASKKKGKKNKKGDDPF